LQRIDQAGGFTAATSVVWSFEFTAFWMMFFEGYMGAPPTVTVCSFICASVGVAATAAKASAATAAAVGRIVRLKVMSFLHLSRRASGLRVEIRSVRNADAAPAAQSCSRPSDDDRDARTAVISSLACRWR
jgi:hypothetical protein